MSKDAFNKRDDALQKVALAWTTPKTQHLEMIPELAKAFAKILLEEIERVREECR